MTEIEKEQSEADLKLVDLNHALHSSESRMKENLQKMKHWKKEVTKTVILC